MIFAKKLKKWFLSESDFIKLTIININLKNLKLMSIYKNKNFEICKIPQKIQNAILESQILAAKFAKYNQKPDLKNLALEIEKLENSQEILETNFIVKNWQEVLKHYFNHQLEIIKNKNPYSFLNLV